ncbi:hypothetical protein B9N62_10060 [Campylobacter concisus]|uniref:Endonuclease GajA/Old nuclease/RecF-like AAA domain-containing protein n=1 Tax=Campylobacter concisus TaxID=199 RepID=A0A1Y5MSZ8_9BACT|nr:AAA family ATPase [Campylobacter concisus]OUT10434.1 hypothetical protein B9N62_10060 [Campylobacter concisus]
MQKVIIQKLGPINYCEITIKPFTIFIGDSGTGKSIILRTISLLKWIYKKMQYKAILKHSKTKTDALRFRLDGLLKNSMLEDFFTKDTYVELLENDVSIIVIKNGKLTPKYKNIKKNSLAIGKILFLNDIRSSLPEILSSPSGKRARFSYYTSDMIENFYKSFYHFKKYDLDTIDLSISSKKRVAYDQIYVTRKGSEIKFENASSGEKNLSIIELICSYFAEHYDFANSFSNTLTGLIVNGAVFENLGRLQDYLKNNEKQSFMDIFIEEPEANLFPEKQKRIAYYLASLQKTKNAPELILSTHSPYILTSVNNLLYASELVKQDQSLKEKVTEIIDDKFLLDAENCSAYLIEGGVAKSIIDKETNLINADELDSVSGSIMQDFERLMELQ